MMRMTKSVALLAGAVIVSTPSASSAQAAQATTDARWRAWVGCWQPEGAAGPSAVCVLPAGGSAVDVVTVVGARVESRERIDASGAQLPSTRDKCAGWDQARWSPHGRRVYLRSEHTCDGVKVGSTGVMAIAASGEWLDVRGASLAGGPAEVRVRRYQELADSSALPADLRAEVRASAAGRESLAAAARANAADGLATTDVVEATREVDPRVVEAWLIERGDRFALDAKRLLAMADAGVPERVIDLVVALTYPAKFAVNEQMRDAELRPPAPGDVAQAPLAVVSDPYGIGYAHDRRDYCYDPLYAPYASAYCYGYSPYGWGRNVWSYGYSPYGYGAGGPVIVVREPSNGSQRDQGRAVKGRGYSTGSSGGTRTAHPRDDGGVDRSTTSSTSSRPSSSGSGGSTSSGSTSSGSKGTSSSSGGGRTAKPRNP